MKKNNYISLVPTILIVFLLTLTACQSEGGVWLGEGENYGRSYVFGTPAEIEDLKKLASAYSAQDTEKLLPFYNQEFLGENGRETTDKWLQSMESISMKPYKIIPLHSKDGKFKQILAWSKEERIYKNGSYEKLDLMEQFRLDEEGKVRGFRQWVAIDSVNFGQRYGGKYLGRKDNPNTGRPFVFSNRNETSIVEQFIEDYNNMNLEGVKTAFADEFTINDYKGVKTTYEKNELNGFFSPYKALKWRAISIVPIKIGNTDASSGVIVHGTESRTYKNGRKWEKDLMEIYYFDLEGKITAMEQFAK